MTAAEILVIFLSVALAIFLVLAIALIVMLILIAKKIKHVAGAAERTVNIFSNVAETVSKAAAPAVISRFIIDQVSRFTENQAKKNKK